MKFFTVTLVAVLAASVTFIACEKSEKFDLQAAADEVKFTDAELKVLYQMRNGDNRIGIDEAARLADEVISFMDEEFATRSSAGRRIASVTALRSHYDDGEKSLKLRSSGSGDSLEVQMPDTVAYLFNFAGDAGFAIVSADTRIDAPVLGYSGSGTIGDTIDNPGLFAFAAGAEAYIISCIMEAEQLRDSLMNDILAKIDKTGVSDTIYTEVVDSSSVRMAQMIAPSDFADEVYTTTTYGPWTTDEYVYPLSTVEWSQGAPYNQAPEIPACNNSETGNKALAGCVATAVAQIMAYWQQPTSVGGVSLNWALLNSYTAYPDSYDALRNKNWVHAVPRGPNDVAFNNHVAQLMYKIGQGVKMDYGCSESNSNIDKANKFLKDCGYKTDGVCDYDYDKVINSLKEKRPVLMRGASTKTRHVFLWINWYNTYGGGHEWVIDGYLRRKRLVTVKVTRTSTLPSPQPATRATSKNLPSIVTTTTTSSTYYNYSNYLRINWGWSSGSNGFYAAGCFDKNADELDSNTKSGTGGNFQYQNKILPNIRW
jgi:hypothetical protein